MKKRKTSRVRELRYMNDLQGALGCLRELHVHRQNVGTVKIRDAIGHVTGVFRAGPPKGAADLTGWVIPEGWRLEIETKAEDTVQSSSQLSFQAACARGGVIYVLARFNPSMTISENVSAAKASVFSAIEARRELERNHDCRAEK